MSDDWSERPIREFATRLRDTNRDNEPLEPLSVTKDHGVVLQATRFKKRVATDLRKYQVAKRGDFVFDPMSMYYGAIGRLDVAEKGAVSPDYIVFRADETVDSDYLLNLLRYSQTTVRFERLSERGNRTGKRRRLYWSVFHDIVFRLPPLPQQRKIAAILSSVDDVIEKNQAVIDQVQVVKKALMQELLTRGLPGRHERFRRTEIGELPESWEVRSLGAVATVGNGTTPSKKRDDYWTEGTVAWLPTGKVNDRIIHSAEIFVTAKAVTETSLRVLPRGTVLIAMIGQGKTRGMAAYLNIEACINQNFAYALPSSGLRSWFLFFLLDHQYRQLRGTGRGSNQGALNCGILKRYQIAVPPADEQDAISGIMRGVEARVQRETEMLTALGDLRSALMSVLLTGEVRVPSDPEAA